MRSNALAALLATGMMGLAGTTASATPITAEGTGSARADCGYYEDWLNVSAYYMHCDNNHVWIEIDKTSGPNQLRCVGPGETHIGGAVYTVNAWYHHLPNPGDVCPSR